MNTLENFLYRKAPDLSYEEIFGKPLPEEAKDKVAVGLGFSSVGAVAVLMNKYPAATCVSVDMHHEREDRILGKGFSVLLYPQNAYDLFPTLAKETNYLLIDQAILWDAPTSALADKSYTERLFHLVEHLPEGATVEIFIMRDATELTQFIEGLEPVGHNTFMVRGLVTLRTAELEQKLAKDRVAEADIERFVAVERSIIGPVAGYLLSIGSPHQPISDSQGVFFDEAMAGYTDPEQLTDLAQIYTDIVKEHGTDEQMLDAITKYLRKCLSYLDTVENPQHSAHGYVLSAVQGALGALE